MQIILLFILNNILTANALATMPTTRIIGGNEADVENYPFMSSIVIKITKDTPIFSGGASIIGKHWAITAAHCVNDFNDGLITNQKAFVRGNTSFWRDDFAFSRDHLVTECIVHEEYVPDNEDYDVGLLRVDEPFDGKFEIPICYANKNYKYVDNSDATTLGWGTAELNVGPTTVSKLRQVVINLKEQKRCTQVFREHNMTITIRMVCASAPNRDACINDSGGPLVQYDAKKKLTLIGIVSWGVECATELFPGVYTKLSEFDEWIHQSLHHHHENSSNIINSEDDSYELTRVAEAFNMYD